ncbi:MAG: LuxR C-terminal-related transcriptional regulator, partial [Burkholderiales bacterium]
SDPGILVQAVREVHAGRRFLSPDIAKILALDNLGKARNPTQELTPREFEIFRMLAEGRKISEIALTLSLSQKTIANHCTQIKQRLDIKSDIELVRLAIRHAIVRVDGPAMKAI